MAQIMLECGLAPMLVALTTLVARRFGPRAGGMLSAFPAIVGPVLLVVALDHGRSFAAQAANGTLLGLVALSGFALAYGRAALRWSWPTCLTAGWAAAGATATVAGVLTRGADPTSSLAIAVLSLSVAYLALPRPRPAPALAVMKFGSLRMRMALTAVLVCALSIAAGVLGPLVGGMLAALPVLASVLSVFTHREADPQMLLSFLRGMLIGMGGFVAFCEVVALAIVHQGTAFAFAAATAAAVVAQGAAVYWPAASRA
ncbi:MAG: DUF3147 family protein [Actinomycetota bacterium]|nr:DUF3147 family protein [Actinomycetota bacterium]